jgi:ribosomal protein S18 acetylase RimI-like enzyme
MSNTALTIRPATADDVEALAALAARVFAGTYGAAIPPPLLRAYLREAFAPDLFTAFLGGPAPLLVACAGPELAGYARMDDAPPPPCVPGPATELAQLYVDARFRGAGVGPALLAAALAACPGRVWLCAWERNARALRFYARHGFAQAGRIDVCVYDIVFPDLVLVREGNPQGAHP